MSLFHIFLFILLSKCLKWILVSEKTENIYEANFYPPELFLLQYFCTSGALYL